MGYVNRCISIGEFKLLFDAFAQDVKANKYNPIPYQNYKNFKRSLNITDYDVCIDYDTYDHAIIVCINGSDTYRFDADDNAFGSFLFDKLSIILDLYNESVWHPQIQSTSSNAYPRKNYKLNLDTNMILNNKEDNKMKFNFDFGPVSGNAVRMSMYGLAVKNKSGTWVSYDAKSGDVMDVDVFNFDGAKFLYKMPVAIKDIAIGDIIVHHNAPMFVVGVPADGKAVIAVDPIAGERKEIMLTKSPFGFNFVTKVVNFLGDTLSGGASAENPFGNLGLMMMLSEDGNGVKDMLPLMLMANGGSVDMSNPLMLYALMGNDAKTSDMLPFMFMMNANKPAVPSQGCNCGPDVIHEA